MLRSRRLIAGYAVAGFTEVTYDNADLRGSEHFRLRDFLTHDQASVWPKYLVLREEPVDKLELVIAELQRSGVSVRHMSGNASGVFVDGDGNGRMDDLNHEGRVDWGLVQ